MNQLTFGMVAVVMLSGGPENIHGHSSEEDHHLAYRVGEWHCVHGFGVRDLGLDTQAWTQDRRHQIRS